ncbi:MAG: RusA family crossover junction endodeoxyribonuclease [Pirellulaceae bacterium]|nr:RusA family crossover junction endodeoxyribonuclease [Pirellulaceae bacterium]
MAVELELPYPPSVNHLFSYYKGRPVLSKDARTYRHQVRRIAIAKGIKPLMGSLTIHVDAFPPDNRRRDIDNCLKSLFDALQHAGAFWDDSQIIVLHAIKHPPMQSGRVLVVISQTEDTLCQESL